MIIGLYFDQNALSCTWYSPLLLSGVFTNSVNDGSLQKLYEHCTGLQSQLSGTLRQEGPTWEVSLSNFGKPCFNLKKKKKLQRTRDYSSVLPGFTIH